MPALAQTDTSPGNPAFEDFEDVIVIGEDRPVTLPTPGPDLDVGSVDPDSSTAVQPVVPGAYPSFPSGRELFAEALIAYGERDFSRAFSQARRAADAGEPRAQVLAAHMLLNGEAPIVDDLLAVKFFTAAADTDDIDALKGLAQLALANRGGLSETDAARYLKRAADLGDAESMRAMSTVAAQGIGVQPSEAAAVAWEQTAAASGDAESLFRQALRARDASPVRALELFEQAAQLGHAESGYEAAILLATEPMLGPDEGRVAELMREAAEAGHPAAMADYGTLVYQGAGTVRDVDAAAEWFRRAAQAGDAEGMFLWAFTLSKGEGVARDFEEAYYWLLRSGASGISEYDAQRTQLRERLEENVDAAILERARARL